MKHRNCLKLNDALQRSTANRITGEKKISQNYSRSLTEKFSSWKIEYNFDSQKAFFRLFMLFEGQVENHSKVTRNVTCDTDIMKCGK